MLLGRSNRPLAQVVEAMGGIQMQYAPAGYIGLWSRMESFDRPMLTKALEDRVVVQGTLMRGTIHTVSAEDYWPMMAGIRRINREWYARVQARQLTGIDMDAVASATGELLADGAMRMADLTAALAARGFPAPAVKAVGWWVDLLRIPPSGTWEQRRADLYGLATWWLPPAVDPSEEDGVELLVRRYLGAFGPAPARDIASWMGLNVGQMRSVTDRMDLVAYRSDDGKGLVDLPDLPVLVGDEPAAPRFLPVWDATLLVHARRTGILPEEHRPTIFNTKTPHSVNTFLVDGRVAGTWRFEAGDVRIEPFGRLPPPARASLEEEAHRLAALHA